MDCNREEALRAKDIAEKKMESKDFIGARKLALKAQQLYPDLDNIGQMLVVCDVHCSAEQKLYGNDMDWYGVLQINQTADEATIKKQYRKFALQLHPDKNKFAGAEAAFMLIGEAQRVLLDKEKRAVLDIKYKAKSYRPTQKVHTNVNAGVQNNARAHFSNLNPQQHQPRQPTQQGHNGRRPSFFTACPFCSNRYEFYREARNRSFLCQNCGTPFIACDVKGMPPRANSSQQARGQQKDGLNQGAFKVDVGSQRNVHVKNFNTKPSGQKGQNVSEKLNIKRKRKQPAESSESDDSVDGSDSEDKVDVDRDGTPGGRNHPNYTEETPRRSTRRKPNVIYNENASDDEGALHNRNEETVSMSGKEAVGCSKGAGESCNHSTSGSASKETDGLNSRSYDIPEAEFNDFDKDKRVECFANGQIWAMYDLVDAMPRFYALIRKVLSPGFRLRITWLEADPDDEDEKNWVDKSLPVACGKYIIGATENANDPHMFSHMILCERIGRSTFKVFPRKGETWALFTNWDIKLYNNVEESHQKLKFDYEFVEILSDYVEGKGVSVAYLDKLKGFVSLFSRTMKDGVQPFQIPSVELFRFSHRVPSFKMSGEEKVGVPKGSFELDPASVFIPED